MATQENLTVPPYSLLELYNNLCQHLPTAAKQKNRASIQRIQIHQYNITCIFGDNEIQAALWPPLIHLKKAAQLSTDLKLYFCQIPQLKQLLPSLASSPDSDAHQYLLSPSFKLSISARGHALSLLNVNKNIGIYAVDDIRHIPMSEKAAPGRILWHWWFHDRGNLLLHAGAVAVSGQAALLIGGSGSGKSTTALHCLSHGLEFLGDDYCLISLEEAGATIHSLYHSAKLDPLHLHERLDIFEPHVINREMLSKEKALLLPSQKFSDQLRRSAAFKAIVLPRVNLELEQARLSPISKSKALQGLAPSSLLQMPGLGQKALSQMTQLVKLRPCFMLEIGQNLSQIPKILRRLLESA